MTAQEYKSALQARMRQLARSIRLDIETGIFIDANDKRMLERKLIRGIARLHGITLPVQEE